MKSLIALTICAAAMLFTGCAANFGSTTYYDHSHGYLDPDAHFSMSGISGRVAIENEGPGDIMVMVYNSKSEVIHENRVRGKTHCMITVRSHQSFRVENVSEERADFKVKVLD